jgi:hypothetical protein
MGLLHSLVGSFQWMMSHLGMHQNKSQQSGLVLNLGAIESLLAIDTVMGMTLQPLKQVGSHVILYHVINCNWLQLLHHTTINDGPVLALTHFQG